VHCGVPARGGIAGTARRRGVPSMPPPALPVRVGSDITLAVQPDLSAWLSAQKLGKSEPAFLAGGVTTMAALRAATDADLAAMGLKNIQKKRIRKALGPPVTPVAPAPAVTHLGRTWEAPQPAPAQALPPAVGAAATPSDNFHASSGMGDDYDESLDEFSVYATAPRPSTGVSADVPARVGNEAAAAQAKAEAEIEAERAEAEADAELRAAIVAAEQQEIWAELQRQDAEAAGSASAAAAAAGTEELAGAGTEELAGAAASAKLTATQAVAQAAAEEQVKAAKPAEQAAKAAAVEQAASAAEAASAGAAAAADEAATEAAAHEAAMAKGRERLPSAVGEAVRFDLKAVLEANKLTKLKPSFERLGVDSMQALEQLTDEQLGDIGLKSIQKKRLRKYTASASGQPPSSSKAEPTTPKPKPAAKPKPASPEHEDELQSQFSAKADDLTEF